MKRLSIDIDSLVLRLGVPMTSARAEGIANGAVQSLEALLRSHPLDYSSLKNGFHVDSLSVPSISIGEGVSDTEISRAVAYEIYRILIKEGGI